MAINSKANVGEIGPRAGPLSLLIPRSPCGPGRRQGEEGVEPVPREDVAQDLLDRRLLGVVRQLGVEGGAPPPAVCVCGCVCESERT